jgi:hypothetical protein
MSDGANRRPTPLVPCAHTTTGHPPAGGVPYGTSTTPDAGTGWPLAARER